MKVTVTGMHDARLGQRVGTRQNIRCYGGHSLLQRSIALDRGLVRLLPGCVTVVYVGLNQTLSVAVAPQ